MMRMTETIRDDEHDKDVMVQLMFRMLCPTEDEAHMWGCHCRCRLMAPLKRRLSATTATSRRGSSPSIWRERIN